MKLTGDNEIIDVYKGDAKTTVTPRSADVLPTAFLPKIQAVSLPSASQP
jgi:hypothetical protein